MTRHCEVDPVRSAGRAVPCPRSLDFEVEAVNQKKLAHVR